MSSNVKAIKVLSLHARTTEELRNRSFEHIQQNMSTTVTSVQFDKSKIKNFGG